MASRKIRKKLIKNDDECMEEELERGTHEELTTFFYVSIIIRTIKAYLLRYLRHLKLRSRTECRILYLKPIRGRRGRQLRISCVEMTEEEPTQLKMDN